jgi:plasmid stabilization system protein ParE
MPTWSPASRPDWEADVLLRWTDAAEAQLDEILHDLEARRSLPVRRRLLVHLLGRIGALAETPWAAPPWRATSDASFRRLVVDHHVVIYRVLEDEGTVFVLAVRHGRARPLDPEDLPPSR